MASTTRTLAREALSGLSRSEDLTDRVFLRIDAEPALRHMYDNALVEHGKKTVNQAIGREVKEVTDATSMRRERRPRSRLINSYTRLKWQGRASGSKFLLGERQT